MSVIGISEALQSTLNLDSPPIALAFVQEVPTNLPLVSQPVPSACSLWLRAEREVFFAPAEAHFNCPIGSMTMGFEMPAEVEGKLMELVTTMVDQNYLDEDEPKHIPSVPGKKSGIVYGPLDQFPLAPDLALVWASPAQAMILEEALGETQWNDVPGVPALGRPACAALPLALQESRSTISLGCMGMRTLTGVDDSRLLVVLPGSLLDEEMLNSLETTSSANRHMFSFYQEHKALFPVFNG